MNKSIKDQLVDWLENEYRDKVETKMQTNVSEALQNIKNLLEYIQPILNIGKKLGKDRVKVQKYLSEFKNE